jgi:hypothetical protein
MPQILVFGCLVYFQTARCPWHISSAFSNMPSVDPAVVEAFKKVKKDTSMDWNTMSIKLDAAGEVCSIQHRCFCSLAI